MNAWEIVLIVLASGFGFMFLSSLMFFLFVRFIDRSWSGTATCSSGFLTLLFVLFLILLI